jgi:4,5-DOPA dioxygenase extradiol
MLAVQDDDPIWAKLRSIAARGPRPSAAIVVSAHWVTPSRVELTANSKPDTIHDFGGFPRELYDIRYACPGSPELAARACKLIEGAGQGAILNGGQGLDHGAWVPLRMLWPEADVPIVQLSMPVGGGPAELLRMGKALQALRDEGVWLIGSGGAVHNLRELRWNQKYGEGEPWARDFEAWVGSRLAANDIASLLLFESQGPRARDAHPTTEHFLPLFFALGARADGEAADVFHTGIEYATLSLLSAGWGLPSA